MEGDLTSYDSEWTVLRSSSVESAACDPEQVSASFHRLVDIWRDQPHTVNRRLAGAKGDLPPDLREKVLKSAEENYGNFMPSLHECTDVEVRRLISKSDVFSSGCFEVSFLNESERSHSASFFPVITDEHKNPHVTIPYRISAELEKGGSLKFTLETASECDDRMADWLTQTLHPTLLRWLKNMRLNQVSVTSVRLVDIERYADTYRRIKETYGKDLARTWPERTSAQKFVFEDCAIAAYLVELWRDMGLGPQTFVDIGCGNGLLVYLLQLEGHNGIGLDLRKRNIWDRFESKCDLRVLSVDPSGNALNDLPRQDWLIGNHSDELTPWIPVMAAKSASNFFLLPCCPFDFYGKFAKGRKSADGTTHFPSYIPYVRSICDDLGFDVEEDRLKIPSTKRACFIGTIPKCGLPADLNERIALLTNATGATPHFVARPAVEVIRNCIHLPIDFRKALTLKLFNMLLEAEPISTDTNVETGEIDDGRKPESKTVPSGGTKSVDSESRNMLHPSPMTSIADPEADTTVTAGGTLKKWRKGGCISLADCATQLSADEKFQLKSQCGGLQTFLRNQHQVFSFETTGVRIRDWERFGPAKRAEKRSLCWFYANHPDGCPLTDDICTYLHTRAP